MKSFEQLLEISSRLDHLENAAEWIARETVHSDNTISQTSTMICALADDLRQRICTLVREVEEVLDYEKIN